MHPTRPSLRWLPAGSPLACQAPAPSPGPPHPSSSASSGLDADHRSDDIHIVHPSRHAASPRAESGRTFSRCPDPSPSAIVANTDLTTIVTPPPARGLIDSSSALVIHWFDNVCPAWSGFDSNANPIRTIAVDVWRSSVTVGNALEAMSAAFLASRDPSMRRSAMRLMRRAADYAQVELGMMRAGTHPSQRSDGMALPTGLLFSLFGVGTTVCWVDAHSLGLPFLRETRRLLARLNRQQRSRPGAVDAERLEFFNKCMTYCDMLLSVVHDDDDVVDNYPILGNDSLAPPLPPYLSTASFDTGPALGPTISYHPSNIVAMAAENRPHPWTGISSLSSRLFAETMGLCRRVQLRSGMAAASLPAHYLLAERLEEQLLNAEIEVPVVPDLDIPSGSLWHLGDTGDARTPPSHLALIAEAYRLSSLLVFYETFPSFGFLRLRGRMLPTGDDGDDGDYGHHSSGTTAPLSRPAVLWQEWITPLSLHLLQVLERIPLTSGSRVIQPLLYICASTGLRQPDITDEPGPEARSECESLKVRNGRSFVLQRLSVLESSLPPTPVTMAKELVRAIWRAYDASPPGSAPVHWINVMEAANLRSMFG
ncbi:hypothetical protein SEPCBS119000_001525 [Sporothrix epigloea]|uniref:C6 zinc finger domain containing protein n=1 Tax=Sporothrix epigloea TaxID=1892477 RepID=A0ABP0DB76_9PEZI